MNDSELLKQFQRGDREAFSQLVQRYARPLTLMILRLVRNKEEAKDISQTVFLKAYEGLPRFLGISSFKTWLYTIAVNTVRDHLRKNRPLVTDILEELHDPRELPDERLDLARYRQRLRSALDTLPDKQRLTLQLRVYEEMDYSEIARMPGGAPIR